MSASKRPSLVKFISASSSRWLGSVPRPLSLNWILLLLGLGLLLGPRSAHAATLDPTSIETYIQKEMEADRVPGVAVVVVQGDTIIYARGFGKASESRAVTPETAFVLGSMSKSFTAMAILQLVEQGVLELDRPVQTYLPDFSLATPQASAQITLRHLLHHTSGIPTNAPQARDTHATLADHITALQSVTPLYPPGEVHLYASANYQVLGRVVEVVSGQAFGDYIDTHIFTPLAMTHSYTTPAAAPVGAVASGYQYWFGFPQPSTLPYETARLPTAALTASAEDLGHYLIALLNGGVYENRSVLSAASLATLFTPTIPAEEDFSYAMGWRIGPVNGSPAIHHGGIVPDFRGKMVLLPEQDYAVAVLTNSSSFIGTPTSHRMADNIAAMLMGREARLPTLSLTTLYLAITIGIGLLSLREALTLLRLRHWYSTLVAQAPLPTKTILRDEGVGIFISGAVLLYLPGRLGMDWQGMIAQIPDIGWWLIIILPLGISISTVKLILLTALYLKQRRVARPFLP